MKFKMENKIITQDEITFRDLGYGQKLLDRDEINYEISLSHEEFREVVEDAYNKFVCETKEDDEVTNYSDSIGLYEIGYPDFNNSFINHKELLVEIIKDYLYQQLLEKCTSQCSRDYWKYAINSIEQIIIHSDHVIISGEAFEIKKQ